MDFLFSWSRKKEKLSTFYDSGCSLCSKLSSCQFVKLFNGAEKDGKMGSGKLAGSKETKVTFFGHSKDDFKLFLFVFTLLAR